MSLLFNLVAKHSVEESDKVRFCSYPRQTPYMLINYSLEEDENSNEEDNIITSYNLFNPRSEQQIKITDKKFPKVSSKRCVLLGTSRGWAVFMRRHDSTILLSDVFNPWSSGSTQKTISLPSFTDPIPDFKMPVNVSLSTPFPDQENDYIVSLTFNGSKLSYCMPNRDSEWTNIKIPFSCDKDSQVVYSRINQMFYLLTTGCAYIAALDLKNNKNLNFLRLQFKNFPLIPHREWEILASCLRINYMAESSSGECFIVLWYLEPRDREYLFRVTRVRGETKRFMVFRREDEDKCQGKRMIVNYTENIGDLCILIGQNETFCLEASKYPGLRPNSIYYVGYGFGVYDISNNNCREYCSSGFHRTLGSATYLSPLLH